MLFPSVGDYMLNKEERYSRVPRLSDTRYSVKGTKGKWRYASLQSEIKMRHLPAVDRFKRNGRGKFFFLINR